MKIVVLDGYTENPGDLSWEGFEALGELTVYDRTAAEEVVSRIGNAELVITNKTPIPASVFDYKKTFLLFFHMAGCCLLHSIVQTYYEGRYTGWTLHKVNQFEPALFYEMGIFGHR